MSKTTIDGLTVRTSDPMERADSGLQPRRMVGGCLMNDIAPKKKNAAKTVVRRKNLEAIIDDDFDRPLDGDLSEKENEADWSDLLSQLDSPAATDESQSKEKSEEKPAEEKRKARRQKKPKGKKKHIVRKVLLVFLGLILAGGVWLYFWGDGLISRLTNGKSGLVGTIWSLMSEEIPFEIDAKGRTNVLVFGTEGYDMSGTSGNGVHDGAELTDSIMIISFDQKTKDVALLSLPRDLKVPKACYAGKINEVFTCNNENGQNEEAGARALMEQVRQVIGVDFQYWAHVNWGSLVEIVDTIGGITITLDEDINDYEYTGAVVRAGVPVHLNGEQALGVARARHGTNGGDFTRGASQQKVVMGIVQKMIDNGVGFTEALGLLNILGDNLRSNFSSDNIKAGVHLMSGFDVATGIRNVPLIDYNTWQYRYITTATINDLSYVVPAAQDGTATPNNYTRIHEYVAMMFDSNPAVREGASIAVLNATDAVGVAGAEQTKLEADGYTVSSVGNAEAGGCTEKYCLYAMNDAAPGTKSALEARYGITAKSASELPADVVAGNADFVVIIGQSEVGE